MLQPDPVGALSLAPAPAANPPAWRRQKLQWRPPSMESLFVAALVLLGFRAGALPISDNSMLTHLRTGLDMVTGAGVPRADPYSYTAAGHSWTVQSWLAEWTYGFLSRLGGLQLVVLEQGLLTAVLAWLIARLAKTGSSVRTLAASGIALGVGIGYWSPRPLLFGLLAMAVLVTVVDRGRSCWWLVPVAWVWVNTHGSFPLGVLWLGAVALGDALDRRALPRHVLGYLGTFVIGLLLASVNPLGPRLLVFAATLSAKQGVFREVSEWRSPNFQNPVGIFTLVCLASAVAVMAKYRPRWRDLLPAVGFVALGLFAVRNLPVASIVLAPVLGRALTVGPRPVTAGARPLAASPPPLNTVLLGVIVLGLALFALTVFSKPAVDVASYPVGAVDYLGQRNLLQAPHRLAHQEVVGNYLEFRFGRQARVFIDDRFDMYPAKVANDYVGLVGGSDQSLSILDRYGVDVVLWDRHLPLATVLRAARWRQAYEDKDWVVLTRPGS